MRALLRSTLSEECEKHIRRHFEYLRELDESVKRQSRRLGRPLAKEIKRPSYWSLDPRFNPFKTRLRRRLDLYSHTLATKVRQSDYEPRTAVRHFVEKENGTQRELNVFQLPDAALSRLVYKSLLRKNKNRFSGYSYAYREDKDAHDAVHDIYWNWKRLHRVYVAEFDFASFFDNIEHSYLLRMLDQNGFLYTRQERHVIEAFLASRHADYDSYENGPHPRRTKGIPQGTSISLFLANVACWELDRGLEEIGVRFSRYADDTVIWSASYAKIVAAHDVISRNSDKMGVPINYEKSKGIHLVSRDGGGEILSKPDVEYLGYRISIENIAIKNARVRKIKEKLSYILYENLIQPLKRGEFNQNRIGKIDWDYVVAISQIRRYLYGGLNDAKLRQYIAGIVPRLNFRGVMSYYPVVNDKDQLANLDGWLIYVVRQSLKLRREFWRVQKGIQLPGPCPDWIERISEITSWTDVRGSSYDLRIPSFSLISQAMQVAIGRSGIRAVATRGRGYY